MGRVVEMLIALNALGGICTFLGLRWAGRRTKEKAQDVFRRDDDAT